MAEDIVDASRAALLVPRLVLSTYLWADGEGVDGWFRSVIDRVSGVSVMANTPAGSTDVYVTVSHDAREYLAALGSEAPTWLTRDVETDEQPDTGADALLWLGGATATSSLHPDGSVDVRVDRAAAVAAAHDPDAAERALGSAPDSGTARVWAADGVVRRFLLQLPATRRPRRLASRRLVTVTTDGFPGLELDDSAGEAGASRLVADLLDHWPTGEDPRDSTPPAEELLRLEPDPG
ncbi:hypothetical protein [Thalassiella azotivora]